MKIEVECLPDYQWRALDFSEIRRRDGTEHHV